MFSNLNLLYLGPLTNRYLLANPNQSPSLTGGRWFSDEQPHRRPVAQGRPSRRVTLFQPYRLFLMLSCSQPQHQPAVAEAEDHLQSLDQQGLTSAHRPALKAAVLNFKGV